MEEKIRLFIADDHQIIIEGLRLLLEQEQDMEVVADALDGQAALEVLRICTVDIAILDIDMPKLDGLKLTEIIREEHPHIKILILTMYNDEEFITNLIQAGTSGYVLKNRGKEELVEAIRKIHGGDTYFGQAVTKTLISALKAPKQKLSDSNVPLTKREIEVLKLIIEGLTTPLISEKLFIANSTVETHRRNLIDKTGVANSKALITWGNKNGYSD